MSLYESEWKFSVEPAVGLQIKGVDVVVISGLMQSLDASQNAPRHLVPNSGDAA